MPAEEITATLESADRLIKDALSLSASVYQVGTMIDFRESHDATEWKFGIVVGHRVTCYYLQTDPEKLDRRVKANRDTWGCMRLEIQIRTRGGRITYAAPSDVRSHQERPYE